MNIRYQPDASVCSDLNKAAADESSDDGVRLQLLSSAGYTYLAQTQQVSTKYITISEISKFKS